MVDRCCGFEIRSAALYRNFAAGARDQPDLCALWTAMAREEDDHARIINDARRRLSTIEAWMTQLSARWDKVVREVEEKLSEAERLAGGAGADQQLLAALELEMTEMEALRQMLVAVSQRRPPRPIAEHHALRLADAAERFSAQPEVRQKAALLRAGARPTARDSRAGRLPARAKRPGFPRRKANAAVMQTLRRTLLLLLLLIVGTAQAGDEAGRPLYLRYCAACHGREGRGDGPVAPALGEKPTDLTQIAAAHGDQFPLETVVEAIDGTRTVRAHGVSEMPVWGEVFQPDPASPEQQLLARSKVIAIAGYLRSLQAAPRPSH
jgi:mono/diheme cytochrome c family protein